jgi:hypothetical protein
MIIVEKDLPESDRFLILAEERMLLNFLAAVPRDQPDLGSVQSATVVACREINYS